jgi:predicted component of type VI protein secretion system
MPLILVISACTNQEMTKSGFLSDYQVLEKADEKVKEATYINPAASFGQYQSVMIEVTALKLSDNDPEEKAAYQKLADTLRQKLNEQFSKHYRITQQPAPETLYVRSAITGITTANPYINTATTLLVAAPVKNGGASAEAEILDAMTGERLAAITWADEGSVWRMSQITGNFSRYAHAEYLLGVFAEKTMQMTQLTKANQ